MEARISSPEILAEQGAAGGGGAAEPLPPGNGAGRGPRNPGSATHKE